MAKAFAALNVAANIIQTIDFGSKILSKIKQICKHGSLIELGEVESTAREL